MKIIQAEGQTCNQFWIYSNFFADCIDKNEKIIILAPDVSICDFPDMYNCDLISFPFYNIKIAVLFGHKRYIKLLYNLFANKYSKLFLNFFLNKFPGVSYVSAGVDCEKSKYRIKHKTKLKYIYTPKFSIRDTVDGFFSELRKRFDLVIGIHVRLGDYKTYLDGKYYYTMEEYHIIMLQVKNIFKGKKIVFFISSNENIDFNVFQGCNCINIPNSSAIKDLYGLSKTDFIIGPPSTFSAWASFYGDVLLYFVEDPEYKFSASDFINIMDVWAN